MLLKSKLNFKGVGISSTLTLLIIFIIVGLPAAAQNFASLADTTHLNYNDSLRFPIHDRRGDFISDNKKSTYDLAQPPNINDSVAYDAKTQLYTVYEKVGDKYYRTPVTYTFTEYWKMRDQQSQDDYFQQRANILTLLNDKKSAPKLNVYDNLFNRLFGNAKVNIVPQGNVDVLAGYKGQNIENPALPVNARKTGGLDFNMNAQVNVNASIGDKLKFPINYNTLANFGQDNQIKLDYKGLDDEIIKRFEAGNVNFTLPTTFIQGSQQLFGVKTTLQFGKLFITAIAANQKSQRQTVNLQGGAAAQVINLKADQYDENRHFLLSQYFRANYNKVMSNLPAVTTPIHILHMEVWVTNRNGTALNTRNVVGLMDLAESNPYLSSVKVLTNFPPASNGVNPPSNNTNDLYKNIIGNPSNRQPSSVVSTLQNMGLTQVQDFEYTYARKLDSTQYIFNPQVGYLSLSSPLQPNDVLAVAYQYSYNGQIYQVGELSTDVPPDTTLGAVSQVLYLKLLKATSQRTNLPLWGLMMKNVYSIGYGTLSPTDFNLNVKFQEPSLGTKNYVPFGDKNQGAPIISLLNLDRLDKQLDPQPDGIFDYVEGYTVISQYSRIVFPVLEPFGRDLASQIYNTVPSTAKDTLFYALYDSIKAVAQQYPNLNRFVLQGSAHTTGSSDISIGYNIPRGSVTVTANGQTLVEGADYDINYDLGTIKIINQAILNAGIPVQVNFENNASFGVQQKNYLGLRLDYKVVDKLNEQLALGGTIVRLGEKPFFTKVNYGDDPIRNTMYGLDATYHKNTPRLTKLLNKLPNFTSTAPSSITAYGEGAYLKPGHAPQIGKGNAGAVSIDDFEGSQSGIDLRFPATSWAMASTPYNSADANGNILFPEASLNDNLNYGKNRAKLAWYQIDPTLQTGSTIVTDKNQLSDPRVRAVYQVELFPQMSTDFGQGQLTTFDLAFYPKEKGPYNFSSDAANVDANNNLKNPTKRWGGLMRSIDQTDFETANVEFIEFWVQDPFIVDPSSAGGKLYFNLGNVSEDVLKDGKRFYENGLPTPSIPAQVDTSAWGKVPLNPVQITNAFSNDPNDRPYQDIGFDGLNDDSERLWHAPYLSQLQGVVSSDAFQQVQKDPSGDDYLNYQDPSIPGGTGILTRYKNFNGPEGNSPVNTGNTTTAGTVYPDAEDLDRDNTLNQDEEYFQYSVDLKAATDPEMEIGSNFIVDKKIVPVAYANGSQGNETWYQFRIPITAYQSKVGNLPDFSSIRFMRMFLTGFADTVVVRFGELQLTRNSWRNFQYVIDSSGNYSPITTAASFNVGVVNIINDDQRTPFPYRTPTDIQRQQTQSANGVVLLQNEQSMQLQVCGLTQGDARGVFQTFPNLDLRQYGNLAMYIHAEADKSDLNLQDKDLTAVIRIGADFVNNYYQIRIPLYLTPSAAASLDPNSDAYNDSLWRAVNSLNLDLSILPYLKQTRNLSDTPVTRLFSQLQPNGQTYSVMGNPNLGAVSAVLISVENTNAAVACGQIWVDELRLSQINEHGAWAAMGRVDMKLSDLGTITASAMHHSVGFGTIEQSANQRSKDALTQFDVAANLELGKLLPKKAAISIPVYANYSQSVSNPEYDPYNLDIKLNSELSQAKSQAQKDSIKQVAVSYTSTTTINFTNVHKVRPAGRVPRIYDISNFDISYSFISINTHTPIIQSSRITRNRAGLGYNFAVAPKYIEPFKNLKFFRKTRGHWFDLVKDFNFNLLPTQISFKADLQEQFGVTQQRSIGVDIYKIPETYDNYFTFERDYLVRWNLARSISMDLNAVNNSVIDEPYGRADTKAKKDTIWYNLFNGGRNTLYNQTVNLSYALPLAKFPLLSWTTVNLKYQATYNWIGASRIALNLGNILENGQQEEATVLLDFNKLYNRSKFFRAVNAPPNPNADKNIKTRTDTVFRSVLINGIRIKEVKRLKVVTIPNPNALPDLNTFERIVGRVLTSIKQVSFSFSENANTRLPGYMDSTRFLGQNWQSMEPGAAFILGAQPDTNWLNRAAKKGLITRDSTFSDIFQQTYNLRLSLSVLIQPVRDFTLNISMTKSLNKNYSETFKDTTGTGNNFGHLSPYGGGSYVISYTAYRTMFGKFNPNVVSSTFTNFQNDRLVISQRIGSVNKYNVNGGNITPDASGYYYGYGRYSTDVLIPAFLAAYSGQDPHKVPIISEQNPNIKYNPFHGIIPRPNWKLTYSGLSKIKQLKKIFTNITLTEGYNGTLSLNGFTSALNYQDQSRYGYPSFYDTVSRNYVPYFMVPNITIQEQFSPLIGIDVTLVNKLQAKFEYAKSRMLSLSLSDFQLAETHSTSWSIGMGYRKRGIKLLGGIKLPKILNKKGGSTLDNEMNFRFDLKVVDNVSSNSVLDAGTSYATSGSKEITLSPTVDYTLSSRVNVKLYFQRTRVIPYISSSVPTTNTKAGVQIRISLAP